MDTHTLEEKLAAAEQTIARLQQENSQIHEVDTLKNTFIATASHQLRTPLTQLKWVLSIFQNDPEISKMPNQVNLINQAFAGVDRIIDTVNDLVNVSRIQRGKLPFTAQDVDPSKVLNDVIKRNTEVAASRSLTLELHADHAPATCKLDPILFQEAVENLVNNALDYSTSGGKITVTATAPDAVLTLTVENSGIGIPDNEKDKVGMPFFRGQQAIMNHPDGSGLGLYLVRAIAEAHGGTLTTTGFTPEHTSFEVTFPFS
jgi:signal transduction histidine kinase